VKRAQAAISSLGTALADACRTRRKEPVMPEGPLVYAAKFVCGYMPEPSQPAMEGPVEPGSYATAINLHNPSPKPVVFIKKAVLLFDASKPDEGFEVPKEPSERRRAELGPDWGTEIDCRDIREELLKGRAPQAPIFIKGWVVIETPVPLDIVAVYTVRSPGDVSIATDRVIPAQL
jgi:hypothetical protein